MGMGIVPSLAFPELRNSKPNPLFRSLNSVIQVLRREF